MALSTWPSTGPVADWIVEMEVPNEAVILGWAALYWDGSGSVNQADIYSSVPTAWSVEVADPETLPDSNMQGYLVFFRHWGGCYTIWLDGYDDYYLIGKTNVVTGLMLADAKWGQMQARIRQAWQNRSVFTAGFQDWANEV